MMPLAITVLSGYHSSCTETEEETKPPLPLDILWGTRHTALRIKCQNIPVGDSLPAKTVKISQHRGLLLTEQQRPT